MSHGGRSRVVAFGGPSLTTSNDLYEWNGTTWTLLPTSGRPPRPADPAGFTVYLAGAYDARRDKVVLFGSAFIDWSTASTSNIRGDLWEWDAVNGWVSRTVQGPVPALPCQIYFDSHRGVLTRVEGTPTRVAEWDGGSAWRVMTPVSGPPNSTYHPNPFGAYDTSRGKFFVGLTGSGGDVPFTYGSANPAAFESLRAGCPGTQGAPTVALTKDWTRAWIGNVLSIDLKNLPQSTGFLAIGWSDQQAGSFQLPLDLAPFGMPGCHARVATDLIVPLTGANNAATWTTPVPQNNALLGVSFYQQGFAIDPAANAAGLTASNSVRVTIGRL